MFSKPGLYCLPCRIIAAIGSRVEHILHGEPPQQSPRLLVTDGEMHLRELAADLVKWAEVFNDGPELAAKIGIGRDRYMTATVIQGGFSAASRNCPAGIACAQSSNRSDREPRATSAALRRF
jgi:hypothetical protein